MKHAIFIVISASFALPGCISQQRIADRLEQTRREVEHMVAPYVTDTYILDTILPADTLAFSMLPEALQTLPDSGTIIQTPTHTLTLTPVVVEGRKQVKVTAVKQPERVTITVAAPKRLQASAATTSTPSQGWLAELWLIILAIIAFIRKYAARHVSTTP